MQDAASRGSRWSWLTPQVAIIALMIVQLVIWALTFRSYGFTYDEPYGYARATNIYNYFARGEAGPLTEIKAENFYGALADVIALWLQKLIPGLGLDSRHLVSGLFGIVGIYYTYRLGEDFGGRWTGVAAAIFLSLTPLWVGYMFFNLKDIPFGTALLAATYYGVRVMGEAERPRWTTMLALALWCGALGTLKLTGGLLLGFAVLVLLGFFMLERGWLPLKVLAQRALLCAGLAIGGIIVFSIAFWPQLFLFPPAQVVTAVLKFLDYDGWRNTVLLNGEYFRFDEIPRHYLVTYLLITTPLFILALWLSSFPFAIIRRSWALLGVAVLPALFIAIQWVTQAQVYGGYRHFLFTLPFICVAAGYGIAALSRLGGPTLGRYVAIASVAVFAGWSVFTMAPLFPYQYSAYNLLVGGASGAQGRYEIDVWRSAQREALAQLDSRLATSGTESARVYACGANMNFAPFPRLKRVADPNKDPVDYLIWMPRCSPDRPTDLEVVSEVKRGDVLFALVLRALPDVPS